MREQAHSEHLQRNKVSMEEQPYQNYFQASLRRGHLSRAQEALLAVSAHLLLCQLFLELILFS